MTSETAHRLNAVADCLHEVGHEAGQYDHEAEVATRLTLATGVAQMLSWQP